MDKTAKSRATTQRRLTRIATSRPKGRDKKSPIEVAAALVFRNGKLLITERHPHVHLGGYWEFPGGKREPHETFEQCLVRELREELGIEARVGELFESLTHKYPGKTVHLRFFRCELLEGEPQPLGCSAFQWVNQTELTDYSFPEADAQLLEKLRNQPELWIY